MLTEKQIIEIIAKAVETADENVTIDSTWHTVDNWDSLTQLAILDLLDRATEGKSNHVPELATSFTIRDILENLKNADLLDVVN